MLLLLLYFPTSKRSLGDQKRLLNECTRPTTTTKKMQITCAPLNRLVLYSGL